MACVGGNSFRGGALRGVVPGGWASWATAAAGDAVWRRWCYVAGGSSAGDAGEV